MNVTSATPIHIGERVERAIKEKRISQKDICAKLEISRQALNKIFKSEHIKTDYLFKFAEILELPVTYFIGWDVVSSDVSKNTEEQIVALSNKVSTLEKLVESKDEVIKTQKELITELKKKKRNS